MLVEHLVQVREHVEDAGFEDVVTLDFGLYPTLSYYSGVIFEAYAPGVGLPLATAARRGQPAPESAHEAVPNG